ncbi:efflux RND transporter periplasmic adaptor subunit [Marinobacter sp. BGYM27]|uniref:efflux RND transporter periplasmic adaptor subunit n=1 Tax=Marinobacter sp. BGYM27 TaxID=2975597 RepID=UPI0021A32C15|nr:efflux RND transporter periplasmic adaptor subunit [Marinobacter sp. BGYM27]MDG5501565.1 efflux RND transporter periplasmic adaptor subunit [Marinobacter sp. BGYM27]
MGKQLLIGILVLVVAGGGAAALWWQQQAEATAQQQRVRPAGKVNVVHPRMTSVHDVVESVGTLQGREEVMITAEVNGRIVKLNFTEGQPVKKGQLLVQLDDRQARADLRVAEAQLKDAKTQYDRASRLVSRNSISESQVDELRTTMQVAEALKSAAEIRLANHRIEAPFAGVVGLRQVSTGAYLNVGDSVATLDSVNPMELTFSIPERYLGQVKLGQPLSGLTSAFPNQRFEGQLSEMGARLNSLSRTLPVKAVIKNEDGRLRPGLFMAVSLTLDTRDALVIPEQAVLTRGDSQYVFVAVDGQARRQLLKLGTREPGQVEVIEGLTRDDAVIVTGQDRLSSGDPVTVLDSDDSLLGDDWQQSQEG